MLMIELFPRNPPTICLVAIDISPNAQQRIREKSISWKIRQTMSEEAFQNLVQTPELCKEEAILRSKKRTSTRPEN
jgi:hypothetical protein